MQYKITNQDGGKVSVMCLYDDDTYVVLDLIGDRAEEEILKDAYILSKNPQNRKPYEGEELEDLKTYTPTPKESRMEVDFYSLTGKVYDQYGDVIDIPISFAIEGTGAKIEDGKIVEEEVEEETSFFVVAKAGTLEERQERKAYPKVEYQPIKDPIEELKKENEQLKKDMADSIITLTQMILSTQS